MQPSVTGRRASSSNHEASASRTIRVRLIVQHPRSNTGRATPRSLASTHAKRSPAAEADGGNERTRCEHVASTGAVRRRLLSLCDDDDGSYANGDSYRDSDRDWPYVAPVDRCRPLLVVCVIYHSHSRIAHPLSCWGLWRGVARHILGRVALTSAGRSCQWRSPSLVMASTPRRCRGVLPARHVPGSRR